MKTMDATANVISKWTSCLRDHGGRHCVITFDAYYLSHPPITFLHDNDFRFIASINPTRFPKELKLCQDCAIPGQSHAIHNGVSHETIVKHWPTTYDVMLPSLEFETLFNLSTISLNT